ncbi:glycosyltransferase family 2 protein [bacterium]|nr:glycosyltransferase family 2 protein [bacterium]
MRVSGFSFVRNAIDLYYPVLESIRSALPICDEFVVAAGDSTDGTSALLRGIGDPKLRLIETVWDQSQFVRGASNAVQTNIALDACGGDWCFYLQADEVVHEDDLEPLRRRMRSYLHDPRVDGLLFEYLHFYADYDHVHAGHAWYRREVRVVRGQRGIRSWKSAQGFRRADGSKLRVVPAGARIFHYGWVRPPRRMSAKARALAEVHLGAAGARAHVPDIDTGYDFGRLHGRTRFTGTHPAVMRERIAACDWRVEPTATERKHDRLGQRVLSFLENQVLGFRVAEHRNYVLIPP